MGHDNVIEFNGKRYDAVSGAYLGKGKVSVHAAASSGHPGHRHSIDGVVRPSSTHAGNSTKQRHLTAHHVAQEPTPQAHRHVRHAPGKAASAHQPERSKTLTRHIVHKPAHAPNQHIKIQTPAEVMAAPIATIAPKHSVQQINPVRLNHSQHITKHKHVDRFSKASTGQTQFVATLPVHHPKEQSHPSNTAHQQGGVDPFEAAIARSNSHEQSAPKAPRKHRRYSRRLNIVAGISALLLLGGFMAYINKSTIQLRVASVSAGFSARMPGFTPTGYAIDGAIQNKHGVVAIKFRSGESHFQINQQASNWNSQTLLDTLIGFNNYERVESQGRIIYLYDDNKAAWVSGGIRYDITGDAYLNKNDLISLAASM